MKYMLSRVTHKDNILEESMELYRNNIAKSRYYDSVTRLPNRIYFIKMFNEQICNKKDYCDLKSAIFEINIDNFNKISDTFGYKVGNELLKKVSQKLHDSLQKNELLFRIESDEFALVILNYKNIDEVNFKAESIKNLFKNTVDIENEKIYITVSVGIALYPKDGKSANDILKNVDIAMCNAKKCGKDTYSFYNINMKNKIIKSFEIVSDLSNAIKHKNEFILYYQTQIDINNMKVYGIEALLRWNHPKYGILTPAYFIDSAEENGMITEIGKPVLYEACNKLKELQNLGLVDMLMSVNISEKQLKDSDFLDFVKNVIIKTGVEPNHLCFELTERVLVNPTEEIRNILFTLNELGIKIYIDDFGTKYSSLNYLRLFPISGVKLDKTFADQIQNSKKERVIIKNIINLAYELNIEVIAEGVETQEQLDYFRKIKCNIIQGYIFSKPVDKNDLMTLLYKFER